MDLGRNYFEKMYASDACIDGDFNARSHAKYLRSQLDLLEYPVESLIDFGFGKAKLLREVLKAFRPQFAYAIDSSTFAFENLEKKQWIQDWNLRLSHCGIQDWKKPAVPVDLGICNSVLQYVAEENLEVAISKMAKSCKLLYLHVPTQEDYKVLSEHYAFEDPWAQKRTTKFYRDLLQKHFVSVSWGILESKWTMKNSESPFFDSLYRW